ncbi:adenylate/guanylate cyclase domain-containing protein [Persicobacter psychrovividus]|uniref:Guanylate cyclase domain-containing protein n=1 Tax=Persicobacter psychrovividus TaxID=387638 RepID=A0ABN6L5Q6_9BACT|nr:hypothetical protein PEPS_07680 [Persicobacter psychrovividus]
MRRNFMLSPINKYRLYRLLVMLLLWNIGMFILSFIRFGSGSDAFVYLEAKAITVLKNRHFITIIVASSVAFSTWLVEEFLNNWIKMRVVCASSTIPSNIVYLCVAILISIAINCFYYTQHYGYGLLMAFEQLPQFMLNKVWLYFFVLGLIINSGVTIYMAATNYLGPGNLNKVLRGKYRIPHEEDRIFLFADLISSSRTAEILGHKKYSAFIQEVFREFTDHIFVYRAQVYQYVGDEIILSWPANDKNYQRSLDFFYEVCKSLEAKEDYFQEKYGLSPQFNGAINSGLVMAAEVGEVKIEIAYHGDVLNTAARVLEKCKLFHKNLLVTGRFVKSAGIFSPSYYFSYINKVLPKGKQNEVAIYAVEQNAGASSKINKKKKGNHRPYKSQHKDGIG